MPECLWTQGDNKSLGNHVTHMQIIRADCAKEYYVTLYNLTFHFSAYGGWPRCAITSRLTPSTPTLPAAPKRRSVGFRSSQRTRYGVAPAPSKSTFKPVGEGRRRGDRAASAA